MQDQKKISSSKTQVTKDQCSSTKPKPHAEDFYTAYLNKKKKPLLKKIERIDVLKAGDVSKLNSEQLELINKKQEILDDIASIDGTLNIYLGLREKQEAEATSPFDLKLKGLMALHLHQGKIHPDDPRAAEVARSYVQVFGCPTLDEAFAASKKFLENEELYTFLVEHSKGLKETTLAKTVLVKDQPRKHSFKAEHHKEEKKVITGKFLVEEDEEEEEEHKPKVAEHTHHSKKEEKAAPVPTKPALILLPEGEKKEKEEWIDSKSGKPRGNRGRGGFRGRHPRSDRPRSERPENGDRENKNGENGNAQPHKEGERHHNPHRNRRGPQQAEHEQKPKNQEFTQKN